MKIKVECIIKEHKEIEFNLPYYFKDCINYYKVMDGNHFIRVTNTDENYAPGMSNYSINLMKGYTNPIEFEHTKVSEACFNNAFQKALTKINEIASDQLGVEDWSTDAERIEAQDRSRELEDGVEEDFATMWRVGK